MKKSGLEFDWITRLLTSAEKFKGAVGNLPNGAIGPGDDCALWPIGDKNLLLTCDIAVAGRHFQPGISPWDAVGWRLACANVSDVIACGGTPLAALISTSSPATINNQPANRVLAAVHDGLYQAANHYRFHIIGGNLSQADTLAFDLFMLGESKRFIPRSGVRPGDWLALSGTLGEAEAGRMALQETQQRQPSPDEHTLIQYWLKPTIPVQLASWLQQHAHAAIDISDGLSSELHHLANASKVQLHIQSHSLSSTPLLSRWLKAHQQNPTEWILNSGECWQLLITGPPKFQQQAEQQGLTIIGHAQAGRGVFLNQQPLHPRGFTHF